MAFTSGGESLCNAPMLAKSFAASCKLQLGVVVYAGQLYSGSERVGASGVGMLALKTSGQWVPLPPLQGSICREEAQELCFGGSACAQRNAFCERAAASARHAVQTRCRQGVAVPAPAQLGRSCTPQKRGPDSR